MRRMANRPAKNTQAEIARALRAIKQAGMSMAVEISPDGTIRLVPAEKKATPVDTGVKWVT
jgi:hypothetical protein